MNSRSSIDFPPLPPPSGGRPGGGASGEKEHAPRFVLKGVWRNLKKAFTGTQSRHLDPASLRNPQMPYNQKAPKEQQIVGVPELDGRPLRTDPQYWGPRHGAQGPHYPSVPELPPMVNTGYGPRPPRGLGRQGSAMPQQASPGTEIIIALMGVTGAGKSYFIREVSGNPEVVVSGDLYSCTRKVQSYSFEYEGAKITLVDTPGFDDTNRSDTEVLREIADWTSKTYKEKRLLSGIIYLHPITHSRMEGSALKNLRMFQGLCGQEVLKNVFLTTTQWSKVDPVEGEVRENSLRNRDFWGGLIDKGATLNRFHGTRESGLELIRGLIPKDRDPLNIQVQVVDRHMTLLQTDAGQRINEELIEKEKKHRKEIESLLRESEEAERKHREEMESLKRSFEEDLQKVKNEIKEQLEEKERVQKKLEKVLAEKELLAELYAAEVEDRKEREMQEEAENRDRAVIAVATQDLEFPAYVANVFTSYSTRGRWIFDINNEEEFKSNTFGITIHYESSNIHNVQVYAKKFLGTYDARVGSTGYIILDGVQYQCKSGIHRTSGGQNFIIFSKTLDGL